MKETMADSYDQEAKQAMHCAQEQSGKFSTLDNLLQEFNKENNKLLLFSQTKKVLNIIELILESKGIPFLRLDGDVEVKERMSIIK